MKESTWEPDIEKFLTPTQASKLLSTAQTLAESTDATKTAIRDYFIVHLGLATGLRVMEIAALKCGDLDLDTMLPSLVVREGKGRKKRRVYFGRTLRQHCLHFLAWKQQHHESIADHSPLLRSSNTGRHMTTRAIQKVFKRSARRAKLPEHLAIHSLRHTYATSLLKASKKNLRLVQKQLGHSRLTTTQVYLHVLQSDMIFAVNNLNH